MSEELLNMWTLKIKHENIEIEFNKFILKANKESFKILIGSNILLVIFTVVQFLSRVDSTNQNNFFLIVQIASFCYLIALSLL